MLSGPCKVLSVMPTLIGHERWHPLLSICGITSPGESGPRRRGWRPVLRGLLGERLRAAAGGLGALEWLDWRSGPRGCRLQRDRRNRERFGRASIPPKSIASTDPNWSRLLVPVLRTCLFSSHGEVYPVARTVVWSAPNRF